MSLLRDLRHPRVVLLVGVSTGDRLPIMVLEFMAGGDLYTLIHDPSRSVCLFVDKVCLQCLFVWLFVC